MISPVSSNNLLLSPTNHSSIPEISLSHLSFFSIPARGAHFLRNRHFERIGSLFDFSLQQYFFRLFRIKNGSFMIHGAADCIGFISGIGSLRGSYKKLLNAKMLATEKLENQISKISEARKKFFLDTLFLAQTTGSVTLLANGLKWINLGRLCRLIAGVGYGLEVTISAFEALECYSKIKKAKHTSNARHTLIQECLNIAWRITLLAASILGCVLMATGLPFFPAVTNFFIQTSLVFGLGSFIYSIKTSVTHGSK